MDQSRGDYDYTTAGFDGFLTRSIDSPGQLTLDTGDGASTGGSSRQLNFDQSQVSGSMGDTFRVGRIFINGTDGNIIVSDGENDRVLIGFDQDGF